MARGSQARGYPVKSPKAYCGHCLKMRTYCVGNKCAVCKHVIWELVAKVPSKDSEVLRTDDKSYLRKPGDSGK